MTVPLQMVNLLNVQEAANVLVVATRTVDALLAAYEGLLPEGREDLLRERLGDVQAAVEALHEACQVGYEA